jgi:NTE family protein
MRADAVFSGGGVKGLAFAGALAAAEEAGYTEWVQVGGTSAGAITAMALAVGYDAKALRSQLDEFPLSKIADYGPLGFVSEAENVLFKRALTRGEVLHQWIRDLLAQAPRPATKFGELDRSLRVVGTDLAHSRMVVFPDDVSLYTDDADRPLDPDEFPIADAVRISAGYPYFFPPLELRNRATKKEGALVDGGVVSPFPVFLFDKPQPKHPTWGFRLFSGFDPESPAYRAIDGLDWPVDVVQGVLDSAMNALDNFERQSFGDRVVSIATGSVPTLEFSITPEQKQFLYDSGYEAAKKFFDAAPKGQNRFGAYPAQASSDD